MGSERPFITDQETTVPLRPTPPTDDRPVPDHRRRPNTPMSPWRAIAYVAIALVVAFFSLCIAILVAETTNPPPTPKPKRMELPRYVGECKNENGTGSTLPCYWENGKYGTYIVNIDGSTTQLVPKGQGS